MNGPHELTFFTDGDLGHRFAQLLLDAGVRVERHDDHFQPTTPDDEWIAAVARRGWISLTRDTRIRYSPLALSVLKQSKARLFVLVGKLMTTDAAGMFLKWRTRIERLAETESAPFIAKVRRDGVKVWVRFAK